MAREDNNDNDDTAGGGIASSPVWWAAGGVIVLVIAGLLWILLSGGGSGSTATPTRTVTASPTVGTTGTGTLPGRSSPTSAPAAGGCNVPGGNTLVPTAAIPATWKLVGSLATPVSPSAGPKKITGPGGTLRSCFQDSPTGAVIAAFNIAAAGSTSNAHAALLLNYTPGPGRDASDALPADASNAVFSGFLTQACTQSECLVKIVVTVQDEYVEQTMPMIWSGGDWKVNGQVTGVANAVQVPSLSPYISMSASNVGPTS
ncbi:hypothetical protein [Allobranchiibius huperziae]|uniref:DUF8175 domain-containing protein n=1 Tax=Allobranchiibius huperziae TaxID=1874116 RepID=A0A853DIE7_9MICO|nr:hypothetical protein [Allobranchiibius huperziae]NYJ76457.1 hypothetical protein [Allobranchiibius huperziae]